MSSGTGKRRFLIALCGALAILFAALGIWQVERLGWKRNLIAQVDARVHAPPAPLPVRASWRSVTTADAYRHVRVQGVFLHQRETLVEALTERGAGFWVITPLRMSQGTVLINRGFVPPERKSVGTRAAAQIAGPVVVTGLIRMTEPDGRILRANDPAKERWYSRDVAAIARRRGIADAAPFFIDADQAGTVAGGPVGGLTVIHFRNAHLAYALTWFALAALSVIGLALILRRDDETA